MNATKFAASTVALLLMVGVTSQAADAQGAYRSQARPGVFGRTSGTSNNFRRADSARTSNQRLGLPMTGFGGTAPVFGPTGRNGLPVTSLDSFVLNAGGDAEHIYGDEGADGLPPYDEFTTDHRIERGITGARAAGLTTGHGSYLPDAWGGDEFVDGPEWSFSGATGGMPNGGFPIPGLPGIGQLPGLPNPGQLPGLPNPGQLPRLPGIGQLPSLPSQGQLPSLPSPGRLPSFNVPTFGPGGFNISGIF